MSDDKLIGKIAPDRIAHFVDDDDAAEYIVIIRTPKSPTSADAACVNGHRVSKKD